MDNKFIYGQYYGQCIDSVYFVVCFYINMLLYLCLF